MQKGHKVLSTRYTLTAASKSIIPEFLEKIDLLGWQDYFKVTQNEIICLPTGSSIIFSGIKTSSGNQTAALKSLQGVSTFILDEAEELLDEKTFDTIDLSVRENKVQNRTILILNPTTKEHWIYERFFESKGVEAGFNGVIDDVCYIHTTYLDNIENLSPSFVKSVELMKENRPEKYKHQILGGWLNKAEGVIYNNWSIGEFDESLPITFGADFGFVQDPSTLIKVGIDSKRMKIYLHELTYKKGMSTQDLDQEYKRHAGVNLIVADSAEPRLISELKASGRNIVGVKKGAGSIVEGIKLIQDYELVVTSESVNLVKELNNYTWHDKGTKPNDNFNHLCDSFRYAITHALADVNKGKYFIY